MPRAVKPCEFCSMEGTIDTDEFGQLQSTVEVYPDNNYIGFSVVGLQEDKEVEIMYEVPMNYCPSCGRKLT